MQFAQVSNKRISERLPVKKETDRATHLKYVLWYSDGKGVESTKGYFLSVYPVKLDGHFEMSYLFSGTVYKVSDTNKYNEEALLELWHNLHKDAETEVILRNLLQQVSLANSVEVVYG